MSPCARIVNAGVGQHAYPLRMRRSLEHAPRLEVLLDENPGKLEREASWGITWLCWRRPGIFVGPLLAPQDNQAPSRAGSAGQSFGDALTILVSTTPATFLISRIHKVLGGYHNSEVSLRIFCLSPRSYTSCKGGNPPVWTVIRATEMRRRVGLIWMDSLRVGVDYSGVDLKLMSRNAPRDITI